MESWYIKRDKTHSTLDQHRGAGLDEAAHAWETHILFSRTESHEPEKPLSPICLGPSPGLLCDLHRVLVGGGGQRGSDGWSTSGVTTARRAIDQHTFMIRGQGA